MTTPSGAADYIAHVLELYRRTPGTSGRIRRADRRLAAALCAQQVPLATVHAALLLTTARRCFRPAGASPLPPIATLHYFLPVLEELLATPLDDGFVEHLRHRLAALAPNLVSPVDHRLS